MDRDEKKRYFSKSEPRPITHKKDMDFRSTNSPGKYVSLPNIETQCVVVNLVNAVNIDVILNLTPEQKRTYGTVITKPISYSVLDPVTLQESEVVHTIAYRARLVGIAVPNKGHAVLKKKLMGVATAQLRSYIMKTNGLFRCRISDIDVYHRVLIELFDPLTGSSLNEYILNKFHQIMAPYNTPQTESRMNKKYFGKYGSYSASTCTDSEISSSEYECMNECMYL